MNFNFLSHFALGSTIFSQIENGSVGHGQNRITMFDASHHESFFSTIMGFAPDVTFDTSQLATFFSAVNYTYLSSAANMKFRQGTNLAARTASASTVHVSYTATGGLIHPVSLSVGYQQVGKLRCRYIPVYDGTNFPLIYAGNSTITGISNTPTLEAFTLAGMAMGSDLVTGKVDLNIDWGHKISNYGGDDQLYPVTLSVDSITPVITVSSWDLNIESIFGAAGAASPASIIFYLRRKVNNAHHYSDASTQHIKITIPYHHSYITGVNSQMMSAGKSNLMICPQAHARDTAQITVETGSAIT